MAPLPTWQVADFFRDVGVAVEAGPAKAPAPPPPAFYAFQPTPLEHLIAWGPEDTYAWVGTRLSLGNALTIDPHERRARHLFHRCRCPSPCSWHAPVPESPLCSACTHEL